MNTYYATATPKHPRYSLTPDKFLSEDECQHLINLLSRYLLPELITSKPLDFRDAVIISTMLETGARPTEIIRLTMADLNQRTKSVFIRGIKNSRDRTLPLSPKLFSLLYLLAEKNAGGRIFPITSIHFGRIWKTWTPNPKKTLHCLRHTFAVNIYRHTRDILKVKHALGHRAIANTMIYVDFMNDEDLADIRGIATKRTKVLPRFPDK